MERLILDTGVLIGIERGALGADVVAAEDDVAISAITASELLVGVELGAGAGGPRRTSWKASWLVRAATARATGRTVLTTDARAFDDLPGVSHRVVPCG